jgi:hypothetical protein
LNRRVPWHSVSIRRIALKYLPPIRLGYISNRADVLVPPYVVFVALVRCATLVVVLTRSGPKIRDTLMWWLTLLCVALQTARPGLRIQFGIPI